MKIGFGKHKGEELSDIPHDYLEWVLKNCEKINSGLKRAIEIELMPKAKPSPPPDAMMRIADHWHREMAKKFHPDKGGTNDGMKAVNEGYIFLKEIMRT